MTSIRLAHPETGQQYDVPADKLQEAVGDGLVPSASVRMFSPETKEMYDIPAEHVSAAFKDGLVPEGSQAHAKATTSTWESLGRGALQGGTMGFADEISGLVESLFGDKTYEQARDESRANFHTAEQAHPLAYHGGELGGGVATAFIPGTQLAKGAGIVKQALHGAALGGVAGAGYSEANSPEGVFQDVKSGAKFGGALGGGLGALGKVGGMVARPAAQYVKDAFDPTNQLLLALGATKKNFMGKLGDKSENAVKIFQEDGIFNKLNGQSPDLQDVFNIANARKAEVAGKMHELFNTVGDKRAHTFDILDVFREFKKIKDEAPPAVRGTVAQEADNMMSEMMNTGGQLGEMWALKKKTGQWVGPAWEKAGQIPALKQLYMKANLMLDDVLTSETRAMAQQGGYIGPTLAKLEEQYSAYATLGNTMESKLAQNVVANPPNLARSSLGGAMGAGVGSALGGAPGAFAGGLAGAAAQNYMSSFPGRLTRAQIGGFMQHVSQQASAIASGMMPRTLRGTQQWLQTHLPMLQPMIAQMPPLGVSIQNVLTMPPQKAEIEVRALLPMIQQFMAPSPFKTEFDGKVSDPMDIALATKMLTDAKLPVAQHTLRLSKLNKDGTLPPEIWGGLSVDSGNEDQVADELANFDSRIKQMGY